MMSSVDFPSILFICSFILVFFFVNWGSALPVELFDPEEFVRLSELASECRVKRLEEIVKLKLRTPGRLYTIKLDAGKADGVLKRLKCEVVEV